MQFDSDTLSPWSEFDRLVSNASSLRVIIGKQVYRGRDMDVALTSDRVLEITFPERKTRKSAK